MAMKITWKQGLQGTDVSAEGVIFLSSLHWAFIFYFIMKSLKGNSTDFQPYLYLAEFCII